jgi:hypothetical protein
MHDFRKHMPSFNGMVGKQNDKSVRDEITQTKDRMLAKTISIYAI